MFVLLICHDTELKTKPVDSTTLDDKNKQFVQSGSKYHIASWAVETDVNHVSFKFKDTSAATYYVYIPHVQILDELGANLLNPPMLTADQFYAIAPNTAIEKLQPLLEPLNLTFEKYQINTPLRKAHFLAQVCEESDQFNTEREYASGSEYEGRSDLGNDCEGDGARFLGRGLIELTGRFNYEACGKALGVDFVSNPELLQTPINACLSAGWYWDTHGLNELADQDAFTEITIKINGGTNGIDERLANLGRAKKVFGI